MASAVRYIPGITKGAKTSLPAVLQIACSVKPGVKGNRAGILKVSDDSVELCVAAKPKDGEANKAVVDLVASVLGVPKSSIDILKGLKSREKTLIISRFDSKVEAEQLVNDTIQALKDAIRD
ncbi:YggU-like protein [Microthyrium microscopicum]|uniref:YggU-like protein n=1 Tax=Microthyrium microscopicum TaxID=703497 RepID=A0A6A6U059_9PEZI|nr:YggU-like protein [Microthyrium microscopicum]